MFYFFPQNTRLIVLPGTVTVVPYYRYTEQQTKQYQAELDRAVTSILRACFPNGWAELPELNREKILFDWIVRNVVYDYASAEIADDPTRLEEVGMSTGWNAYGALVRRVAVCEGISCAFKLLCNELGLPSIVVLGAAGGGRHAWNIVRVHGKFYHVDCTWDLRSSISREVPYARYLYFNLPDRIICRNHQPEVPFLPVCGSLQFNPFRIKKLCASTKEEALKIAKRMADAGHDRFAIMTLDSSANEAGEALTACLTQHVEKKVAAYADDSGFFIGFVIDR